METGSGFGSGTGFGGHHGSGGRSGPARSRCGCGTEAGAARSGRWRCGEESAGDGDCSNGDQGFELFVHGVTPVLKVDCLELPTTNSNDNARILKNQAKKS